MVRLSRRSKRDPGQALLEFALVLPILMLVICGILDFGIMYSAKVAITNAAREGARYATTHPKAFSGPNSIQSQIQRAGGTASIQDDGHIVVKFGDAADPSGCGYYSNGAFHNGYGDLDACAVPGRLIRVEVSYDYNLLTPVLSNWGFPNGVTISSAATMVEEQ